METELANAQAAIEADRRRRAQSALEEYNQLVRDIQLKYNVALVAEPFLAPGGNGTFAISARVGVLPQ